MIEVARQARPVKAWLVLAGLGWARLGRLGAARHVQARPGELCGGDGQAVWQGTARLGRARPGLARQAWHGWARCGSAGLGGAGTAWQVSARHVLAWRVMAGTTFHNNNATNERET